MSKHLGVVNLRKTPDFSTHKALWREIRRVNTRPRITAGTFYPKTHNGRGAGPRRGYTLIVKERTQGQKWPCLFYVDMPRYDMLGITLDGTKLYSAILCLFPLTAELLAINGQIRDNVI